MQAQGFTGKHALVTGGTSGIGKATAIMLARMGAHVIVSGRDHERGSAIVMDIRGSGGEADFIGTELVDGQTATGLARAALAMTGRIDILVNNAGAAVFGPTAHATERDFDAIYALNTKIPYFLVGAIAPTMVAHGGGAIVNVSTMAASFGSATSGIYGSSKAALNHLTKSWAVEFGRHGVRVNTVAPGPTRTEGTERVLGAGLDQLASKSPLGRAATPDEVASVIVFLAGEEAGMVHGELVHVDGGRTIT